MHGRTEQHLTRTNDFFPNIADGLRTLVLPDIVKSTLKKAFMDKEVDEKDVVGDGTLLTSDVKEDVKLWRTALRERAAKDKVDITDTQYLRLERGLLVETSS